MKPKKNIVVHPQVDAPSFLAPKNALAAEETATPNATGTSASSTATAQTPSPQLAHLPTAVWTAAPPAPPTPANAIDRLFALWYSVLGLGFIFIFTMPYKISSWRGYPIMAWTLLGFTLVYLATVLLYSHLQGSKPHKESWFWAAVMLCLAAPMPFHISFDAAQVLFLILAAAYWTLCVTGTLLSPQDNITSNFFMLDAWNAFVLVPFGNFSCHVRIFLSSVRLLPKKPPRRLGAVLLGLVLALPVLILAIPLLAEADAFFANLFRSFLTQWRAFLNSIAWENAYLWWLRLLFSLPVTAYLFGLVYGCLRKRHTRHFQPRKVQKSMDMLHFLPNATVYTVLGMVCALYLLFMLLQIPYLFSAFTGVLPEGFSFSQYARSGFYQLCFIASINLAVLLGANAFAKTPWAASKPLRLLSSALCGLTLLLLATAASKILLYISAYGLTSARVLGFAFLLWLALVFFAALLRLKKTFSLGRVCLMAGVVLVCLLCVFDLQSLDFPSFLSAS